MFQQLVQTQNNGVTVLEKHLVEIHTKMDSTLVDLQEQIESLGSKLRTVEGQVASTSVLQHLSQLPGKATLYPKEYAHAISTVHNSVSEDSEDQEREVLTAKTTQEIELDFFARLVE